MVELKDYAAKSPEGKVLKLTIASGPVIIEGEKVLLSKHDDPFWKFPGGTLNSDLTIEENAVKEAKQELNVDIKLHGEPFVIEFLRENEYVVLFHFKGEVVKGTPTKGKEIDEVRWFDIDDLPNDCAPNVKLAVEHFRA